MAMSESEIFRKLKALSLEEAECFGKMAEQEELKEVTDEEVIPLVGLLPMMQILRITAKKNELSAQLNETARDSAKSTDQGSNTFSFILPPDRR